MEMQEVVRRGEERYQAELRSRVETAENRGKVLVLDVDSGEYAIDERHLTAIDRLRRSRPEGRFYSLRIGYPSLAKMGGSWRLPKESV